MAKKKIRNKHLGSSLDDFLQEEGILEEATAHAQKKVLAYQLAEEMAVQKISKSEMARRVGTSRSQIDNILNPENNRFQMDTAQRFAAALGKKLVVNLV
jgi:predicted XRE-type DNA-binding protein|tara:strand:+ start:7469 stop:7765 length:297 start_codon:yes stop_codon:yes gene_type:complete